nr:hypothetical protein [Paenibacillus oenotherae]
MRRSEPPLAHYRQSENPFPGISISEPFFNSGGSSTGSGLPTPFDSSQLQSSTPSIIIQPATTPINLLPSAPTQAGELVETAKESGGFSFGNSLNDIKGFVDRIGGIDGIVNTMTKVQKVVNSVSQMAPLIKVLAGSFGKKGDSAAIAEDDTDGLAAPPRRKKRRRTGSGAKAGQRRRTRPRKR